MARKSSQTDSHRSNKHGAGLNQLPQGAIVLAGTVSDDLNFPDRILIHRTTGHIVSVHKKQIVQRTGMTGKLETIFVRAGSEVWNLNRVIANGREPWSVLQPDEMEHIAPPKPKTMRGMPKRASKQKQRKLRESLDVVKSISGAAAAYRGSCAGEDEFDNNCAHFLSDAFLRAGYTELAPPSSCINARCYTTARRPIRARNMWCWFQEMAVTAKRELEPGTGFWAVFQLNESQYWGGHVVIVDTDTWSHYGTGFYGDWDQYAYQW